jgi:hypothetical protein
MSSHHSKPSRFWVTPKQKEPTQEAENLNEARDLGSHSGTLSAKKVPGESESFNHPKFHQKWAMMHPIDRGGLISPNATDLSDVNTTIFSSLIGFAISDICPLWRLTTLTHEGIPQYAARTKFIRNFQTLENACRGKPPYDLIVQSSKKTGDLAKRKIPRFSALAKVLGNYDIPEGNWGYNSASGQVFMSDVNQSGTYLALREEHQNSPLRFHTREEMRAYREACCIHTPYIKPTPGRVRGQIVLSDDLDRGYEEAVGRAETDQSAVNQHFQTLFASTLLPQEWIEHISQEYLVPQSADTPPEETLQNRFYAHLEKIQETLKANKKFQKAFKANREEWIIEALAHFEKFNLHECRNEKRSEVRIDLRAALTRINQIYDLSQNSSADALDSGGASESKGSEGPSSGTTGLSPKDEALIDAAEKRGQHYFLLIKAKEYLSALEGKTKFSLRSFPSTARKILEKLEKGQVTQESWSVILQELDNALLEKSRFRQPITTYIYGQLADLIQKTIVREPMASSQTLKSGTRTPESHGAGIGAGGTRREGSTYEMARVLSKAISDEHLPHSRRTRDLGSLNGETPSSPTS